jgi:dienelactone hydrolase
LFRFLALCFFVVATLPASPAVAQLLEVWPDVPRESGTPVTFSSTSPFSLRDVGAPTVRSTQAVATLFLPENQTAPVPAVVLLHGAGGVLGSRELTYGAQYAAMGVAALVIDVFGARRDRASDFIQRLLAITEAMSLADAYAGLSYLAGRGDIDPGRVALIGFSYGGMATTYAAHAQVAETYAPDGLRFAGHVAYYAPCIARFADPRATGAPVLFVSGGRDAIVDPNRCAEVDADLEAGGAEVTRISYPDAAHQWDGFFTGPRMIGRNLAPCRFEVARNGGVIDQRTGLSMTNRFLRSAVLALCVGREGYLIGRDDNVRARANRDVAAFLNRVLFR